MWFPSSKTCSACGTVNADLKRERMWICPNCGARHDRNLNAAINLRNLIMPEGRGRSGRGQDAVVQQTPWDSWHGEPGVVKEVPPIRECGRGTDNGTEVEGPARGSWNDRAQNAAINPIKSPRRRQNGQGQRRFLNRGLRLHARDVPAAFPSGNLCQFWEGRERETQARRPRRGDRDHRKPTATTNLGNLGIPSGRAPH